MLMDNDISYCSNIARKKIYILYLWKSCYRIVAVIHLFRKVSSRSLMKFFPRISKEYFRKKYILYIELLLFSLLKSIFNNKIITNKLAHKMIDQWICIERGNASRFCALLLLQYSSRVKNASSVHNTYFQNEGFHFHFL